MFQFFARKFFEDPEAKHENVTSELLIQRATAENAPRIYKEALNLFLKIYAAAVGNFLIHHMCVGGVYLAGSLTNSVLGELLRRDFLKEFRERHYEIAGLAAKVPILVCKELDLGLKGAFYVARRVFNDLNSK